jgi:two-component system NarL family sensor kinase
MKPLSRTNEIDSPPGRLPLSGPAAGLRVISEATPADPTVLARALADELLAEEKTRWAYEIHDGLTQVVAAAILQLELLSHRISSDPQGAAADIGKAATEMRGAMNDIRGILFDLSSGTPGDEAPTERLQACVEEVAGRWKFDARLTIEGDLLSVPSQDFATCLLVIHEALTNAAKHAGSQGAAVEVEADIDGLAVSVEDRGRGLGVSSRRFGMRMMERRVREVGGTLVVDSSGAGTRISAHFPRGA